VSVHPALTSTLPRASRASLERCARQRRSAVTHPVGASWETDRMEELDEELRRAIVDALRDSGAAFAFIHGSTVRGTARAGSDIDVAAWWASDAPPSFEVLLPPRVDLLVLNDAPLELAGRVAVDGVLLFDDDPQSRVLWVAQTRKIYFDERPRIERSHREFAESLRRGR
jgi:uncharacterized protein